MTALAVSASLLVASVFSDNMVLQRETPVPVWGSCAPGAVVSVQFAGQRKEAKSEADGKWLVKLDPMAASFEPRTMIVSCGEARVEFGNVLVGEVWLASGQSNMEWTMKKCGDGEKEIPNAARPGIRLLSVPKSNCDSESGELCRASWTECSPETATSFSSVAYFFGCELNRELKVPVGLIDSAVGASRAECWLGESAVSEKLPFLAKEQAALKKRIAEPRPASAAAEAGLPPCRAYATDLCFNLGWAAFDKPSSGDWKPIELPCYWQKRGFDFHGTMWFRKELELPAEWAGRPLTLSLGKIDKEDNTYFNGVKIGSIKFARDNNGSYAQVRVYEVPAELVRKGRNVVAVQARSEHFDAGLYGPAELMKLSCPSLPGSAALPLDGTWSCAVESVNKGDLFDVSLLFNGMISPLVPYALRGAIWYQGESNADASSSHYFETLSALIADWRARWKRDDMSFFIVQLPIIAAHDATSASHWAVVRDAQAKASKLPGCGMICALDLGDGNLHPSLKKPVATRLADEVLAKVYGLRVAPSRGPSFASVSCEGSFARVRLSGANGALKISKGSVLKGFAVAGSDGVPHEAKASLDGADVLVSLEGVASPSSVSYAWADCPDGNLFDSADLPAEPFRAKLDGSSF